MSRHCLCRNKIAVYLMNFHILMNWSYFDCAPLQSKSNFNSISEVYQKTKCCTQHIFRTVFALRPSWMPAPFGCRNRSAALRDWCCQKVASTVGARTGPSCADVTSGARFGRPPAADWPKCFMDIDVRFTASLTKSLTDSANSARRGSLM